ncbi:lysozyme inhibitor LprI family protein [Vibrio aquimaris]|uniref:Lysozyme inhibitor LprI-like N-terminal domain-containing protein n=1 Tax=Vibrio aquimaris TaxID=2587862 RepID=A0A5P9CJV6_9VIBR|nr:lysozyme inhibitor LprI family protein [Vibrio aquimaris]QFT26609.1 hypothetical protein FIV01_09235 [Vibrio aquimaris]
MMRPYTLKTLLILSSFWLGGCAQSTQAVEPSRTELSTETQGSKEPAKTQRSAEYISCSQKALARLDYTRCQSAELQREDVLLNQEYQSAIKRIQTFRHEDLKHMQNLWIKYRDAKCNFFYHKESGSGGQNDAMDCYIDMSQQRTDELKALF